MFILECSCAYLFSLTLSSLWASCHFWNTGIETTFQQGALKKQTSFPLLLRREKPNQALLPSGNPGLTSRDKYKNQAVPEVINTVCNCCLQSFRYTGHWPLSPCFIFPICHLWSKIKQTRQKEVWCLQGQVKSNRAMKTLFRQMYF